MTDSKITERIDNHIFRMDSSRLTQMLRIANQTDEVLLGYREDDARIVSETEWLNKSLP
jgi:hypothetical protein